MRTYAHYTDNDFICKYIIKTSIHKFFFNARHINTFISHHNTSHISTLSLNIYLFFNSVSDRIPHIAGFDAKFLGYPAEERRHLLLLTLRVRSVDSKIKHPKVVHAQLPSKSYSIYRWGTYTLPSIHLSDLCASLKFGKENPERRDVVVQTARRFYIFTTRTHPASENK